jgi:ribose transport system substrate-binding protein
MRKIIFAILGIGLLFFGCEKKDAAQGNVGDGSKKDKLLFGYTGMDMTNPFQIAMRDAARSVVTANGDEFISADGEMNPIKQNNAIEDMITKGIDVLILNPVDSAGIQPALEACADAGIPVVNIDSAVDDLSLVKTYISSNNYQAGYLSGKEMARLFPGGAKICLLEFSPAESVVNRVKGLSDAIKGTGVEIVGRKDVTPQDDLLATVDDLLQAHPSINAFWGFNDDVGLVIQGTVESAGYSKQVRVFSVDGSPSAKKSIANGGLYATSAQSPISIGKKSAECAYMILRGEAVEKNYAIDSILVTPDNVASVGVDDWQ